jgi:hypothetical protein
VNNVITEETALRLERVQFVLHKLADYYKSRTDLVTAQHDHGSEEAYSHCALIVSDFVQAMRDGEAELADTLLDLERDIAATVGGVEDENE